MAKSQGPIRVYHPTLADVSYEVPADQAEAWAKQGWRKTPLSESAEG